MNGEYLAEPCITIECYNLKRVIKEPFNMNI